jgi:hypothetical protein
MQLTRLQGLRLGINVEDGVDMQRASASGTRCRLRSLGHTHVQHAAAPAPPLPPPPSTPAPAPEQASVIRCLATLRWQDASVGPAAGQKAGFDNSEIVDRRAAPRSKVSEQAAGAGQCSKTAHWAVLRRWQHQAGPPSKR